MKNGNLLRLPFENQLIEIVEKATSEQQTEKKWNENTT